MTYLKKKDGSIGNAKFLFERGDVSCFPLNTKNNKYTVIGVTLLDGTPLMCARTIQGIDIHAHDCSSIDIFTNPVGDIRDKIFVRNNTGRGKNFLGGPECTYKNKIIPSLV